MVRFLIELCRALMRRLLPPSCSTVSTPCIVTSVLSDGVAVGRPELAGWRALRQPEVANAVNYELIGYLEVSRQHLWLQLDPLRSHWPALGSC